MVVLFHTDIPHCSYCVFIVHHWHSIVMGGIGRALSVQSQILMGPAPLILGLATPTFLVFNLVYDFMFLGLLLHQDHQIYRQLTQYRKELQIYYVQPSTWWISVCGLTLDGRSLPYQYLGGCYATVYSVIFNHWEFFF